MNQDHPHAPQPHPRQVNQEEQHLDLLAIFHYIVGGLAGLFACIPIIHLAMGIAMLTGAFQPESEGDAFPLELMGTLFVAMSSVAILLGWTLAVLVILAGRYLKRRRAYTFCLVVAGIECIFFPFGTALGVFALIVLLKPETKSLFRPPAAQAHDPTASH